jgi:hypothetical protein
MERVEQLLIFLASPGDVPAERRHVAEVVDELNRSARGVALRVLSWEHDTFPGYGGDAQEVINAQIAEMKRYALFVGIMWNRLGTPTPRAPSGTVEEFERAAAALSQSRRPEIWFYFREPGPDAEGKSEERRKVLAFKERFEKNGLPRGYKDPSDFRDEFRKHLLLWLSKRGKKRSRYLIPTAAAAVCAVLAIFAILFFHRPPTDHRKHVLLMDSYAEVYDEQTNKDRETNAHVIERVLQQYRDEIRLEKELVTENISLRYEDIVRKNPDLIVIHKSSFYPHPVEGDPYRRLIGFLRAMAKTKTKFLIYTRSITSGAAERELLKADIINEIPEMKGRVEYFTFPPGRPMTFRDSDVAAALSREARKMLGQE